MKQPKVKNILTKKEPERNLLVAIRERAGRNNSGKITIRHRGGGVKRLYRIVNFGQEKINIPGTVKALEYDPNRTAFLALIEYSDKTKAYILAPQDIKIGDIIITAETAEIKIGNRIRIKNIPVGTEIHNIEIEPSSSGKMIRSAGSSARILTLEGKYVHLQMPSKEVRKVNGECFATIGSVSHPEHRFTIIGKAGRVRNKRRRPQVRGLAMNTSDHPHGGGEGRTGIGFSGPKTRWGKPAMGVKTRKRKDTNKFIIKRRPKLH